MKNTGSGVEMVIVTNQVMWEASLVWWDLTPDLWEVRE